MHDYHRYRDHHYHDHCSRLDDLLLYELMRERDRDRERRREHYYDVDRCNPYYSDLLCHYRRY